MKLSNRYNRVNLIISLVVLLLTGLIYYVVIHFILTEKLDRDLTVEENEIKQYVQTFKKLPLPASYLDQQVSYKAIDASAPENRQFLYTTYKNPKEKETEPGRSLITRVDLNGKSYQVMITKSRVESEDLVRIILLITLGVTLMQLILLMMINRFVLNQLWKPFYTILNQMKVYEVTSMENIHFEQTKIDEFNELNESANAMALRVRQDYRELKSFTDNASHEMMTPLAVINSKLDSLLQTEPFTTQQGSLLEDIYHATGRLSRLHQSLLLLAKIEHHMIQDFQEIDFLEMTENKIRQFNELLEKDNLTLIQKINPAQVRMSRYLVDILLNNLFSNAVRHNHPGGAIEVKLDQNSFQISNTGNEMELGTRLFDRFSKSTESEGMGLGLAISKQICNLYGFYINYEYKAGRHFFTIYFRH